MSLNNINLSGMMAFVEQAKRDPSVLKKQKRVEGAWNFQEGRPQFTATIVALAAAESVILKSLKVVAENQVDLTRAMGMGDKPVVERVSLRLLVDSDCDTAKLEELERLARDRCPGVYCLTKPIPLDTRIERASR